MSPPRRTLPVRSRAPSHSGSAPGGETNYATDAAGLPDREDGEQGNGEDGYARMKAAEGGEVVSLINVRHGTGWVGTCTNR